MKEIPVLVTMITILLLLSSTPSRTGFASGGGVPGNTESERALTGIGRDVEQPMNLAPISDRAFLPNEEAQERTDVQEPEAGSTLQDTEYAPVLVYIPSGSFMMGSEGEEDDEEPIHRVRLNGFYIGRFEVTQAEWRSVMGDNPSHSKGDDLPVERVSWNDAAAFCTRLSEMTGSEYRLPTEAEWECAACAGTTTEYSYDSSRDSRLGRYAWYGRNSNGRTHPVGQQLPNEWGLFDIHGNVWEWCEDWFGPYPDGPVTNPVGPSSGPGRIIRGGSWGNRSVFLRSAFRTHADPNLRHVAFGFRCVRER